MSTFEDRVSDDEQIAMLWIIPIMIVLLFAVYIGGHEYSRHAEGMGGPPIRRRFVSALATTFRWLPLYLPIFLAVAIYRGKLQEAVMNFTAIVAVHLGIALIRAVQHPERPPKEFDPKP